MKYIKMYENSKPDKFYIYPVSLKDLPKTILKFMDNKDSPLTFVLRKYDDKNYYIQFNNNDAFYGFLILNYSFPVEKKDLNVYGKELTKDEIDILLQTIKYNL